MEIKESLFQFYVHECERKCFGWSVQFSVAVLKWNGMCEREEFVDGVTSMGRECVKVTVDHTFALKPRCVFKFSKRRIRLVGRCVSTIYHRVREFSTGRLNCVSEVYGILPRTLISYQSHT